MPLAALSAAGVTVLIDARGGRLPSIVHWGAALPGLDQAEATTLADAASPVVGSNNIEPVPRLAILPEHHTGWTGRPGLRGSYAGRGWSPKFALVDIRLDGHPIDGFASAGPGVITVTATADSPEFTASTQQKTDTSAQQPTGVSGPQATAASGQRDTNTAAQQAAGASGQREAAVSGGLELTIEVELLPSGLLRGRATVINRGGGTYQLDDLVLAFPVPAEANELLDFGGRHNFERRPQRTTLHTGIHLRENRKGRTGADSAYLLHAGTPGFGFARGEIWAVHTAWSGNHTHYAERVFTGEQVLGGGELLLPGEVRLDEGQGYASPWLYGSYGDGLDEVARRFHRHLRARERKVSADRPVTLNVWEAVYFKHDLDQLLDLAERAAAAGVERYVLDDGWFGARRDDHAGLGDWVVSPDVWPRGLHPLVEGVRKLGMQFGLWFEPEMVNPDSDLARAHPEWIMSARADRPVESRSQQVLNLGVPAAYEHVKGQILAILDEYDIGYVKWDHNRDLIDAGDQTDGGRPGVHAQTLAFYRLLDEIRAAHPALEIESCSSGGARVDLAVLERTDRVWVSDNIDPHDRQSMLRWTTQLIPPEFMGSHIASGASHTTGRRHDLGFRAATAVFGHLGVEWDLAKATPAELEELGSWIAFFKEQRGLLLSGSLVRMDTADPNILVHGVVAPGRESALFALVALDSVAPDPPGRMRLRGLDPARRYRVHIVNTPPGTGAPTWWKTGVTLSGAALEHAGLAFPHLRPDQAVLCRLEAVT